MLLPLGMVHIANKYYGFRITPYAHISRFHWPVGGRCRRISLAVHHGKGEEWITLERTKKKGYIMKRLSAALSLFSILALAEPAAADIVDFTVDAKGTVALGGTMVILTGSATCAIPPDTTFTLTDLFGNVLQVSVGGKVVATSIQNFAASVVCDGTNPVPFSIQLSSSGSPFKSGKADVSVILTHFTCNAVGECSSIFRTVSQKVTLNP